MVEIILNTGQRVPISNEDIDLLEEPWQDTGRYAKRNIDDVSVYLHVVIGLRMGHDPSKTTDHKDRNTYNCQRSNLREATRQQQSSNRDKPKSNSSGFKGVDYYKGRWRARIRRGKVCNHLGYFDSSEDAARAYDRAATRLFGEFAVLNFPEEHK